MLILIWRYSRALIHYELEYLLYNCTHETIDNMADFTKIQSSSDLSYGLSLVITGGRNRDSFVQKPSPAIKTSFFPELLYE